MNHAVVLGAGIVGAAVARELAEGGLRVDVFDRATPGSGTTATGMGHIVVMDDSPAQLTLTSLSRRIWAALAPRLPPAAEYRVTGTLWIAADADELEGARAKHDALNQAGVAARIVTDAELSLLEPGLATGLAGALLVPDDAVVYQPAVAAWLLQHDGITLHPFAEASSVGDGIVRFADGTGIEAPVVVNAAGLAAADLMPNVPAPLVRPRRGHLAITERYPGALRHQVVELGYQRSAHTMTASSVAFNLQPRATGQILIGSSRELDREDTAIERGILDSMLTRAIRYFPALADMQVIRTWTGVRPATMDKLPIIGQPAGHTRTWIAAGHEGLGITTATGTARLIADMILGRTPTIDPTPFRCTR